MKNYDQLTRQGKVRRMHQLALVALEQFDLEATSMDLLGWFTNLLFRVKTASGESFVLRICAPGWRTDTDLRSEAAWLDAIHNSSHIAVPHPVRASDGDYLVRTEFPGIPGERKVTLMSWVPGVVLGKRLNESNLYKMGQLFARLHTFSLTFVPPPGFTQRKMECVLARGEQNVLFSPPCLSGVEENTRRLLLQIKQRVEQSYDDLYAAPQGLRVIHHDLWHDNIKIYRGQLIPLDFEDTVWGYPVQDIAMALQDLMLDVEQECFEPLQSALRAGYESLSPWAETYEGQIDVFRAGRMLWVANYVASYQAEHLAAHLAKISPVFENFLETGLVRKPV